MRLAAFLSVSLVACSSYGSASDSGAPDASATASSAIYVAPDGRDFAEGTKQAPVATFRRALEIAAGRGTGPADVFACAGTYGENVVLDRAVHVVGNLSCSDWSPGAARARIATVGGAAVTIADTADVVVEQIDVEAAGDHTSPGSSAVGVLVVHASGVVLRNMTVTSGDGIGGVDGATAPSDDGGAATNGTPATTAAGGIGPTCTCKDGTSSRGGDGGGVTDVSFTEPTSGEATPSAGQANAGLSGRTACVAGSIGGSGATGADGSGAPSPFTIDGRALRVTTGGDGKNGNPGQGGGGGGANGATGIGGGGGACGGCGGGGGGGGTSGGASIAILSVDSDVLVDASALVANAGGTGGRGGDGAAGQTGGAGGAGGCAGATGGAGGDGGNGGGGAGGHSAGVAWSGAQPRVQATTMKVSRAGDAGAAKNAGAAGQSAVTLMLAL